MTEFTQTEQCIKPHGQHSIKQSLLAIILIVNSTIGATQVTSVGTELPGLEAFDIEMLNLLKQFPNVPGASLAVAKEGKILLVKGYGFADKDKKTPVTPDTLFRMGSINKTLTSVAVMKLVEDGKLTLDEPVLPLLSKAGIVPTKLGTSSAVNITVRMLLQHTGGMDRGISGDPIRSPRLNEVVRRQNIKPATCEAVAKDTLEQPLDFEPGMKYAYSNVGYCMLGKIVEVASGMPYQAFVSKYELQPSIGKNYLIGLATESMPGETTYHTDGRRYPFAPGITGSWLGALAPYGRYSFENMEALGAWVATPIDALRFFLAVDGAKGNRLISQSSLEEMQKRPVYGGVQTTSNVFYGLGIFVNKKRGTTWFHSGGQAGVRTIAVRAANGISWVMAFNGQSDDPTFDSKYDAAIWKAINSIDQWPTGDLFEVANSAK